MTMEFPWEKGGGGDGGGFDVDEGPIFKEFEGRWYIWDPEAETFREAPGLPGDELFDPDAAGLVPFGPRMAEGSRPTIDARAASPTLRREGKRRQTGASIYQDPYTGALFDRSGKLITDDTLYKMLYGSPGGGSGDGVSWANLAQRRAEFEWEKQQAERAFQRQAELDRLRKAQEDVTLIMEQAAQADARRRAAQEDRLAALPFVAPRGMTHFPGLGATGDLVELGLAEPMEIAPVAFDPDRTMRPGPYDAAVQKAVEDLRAMGI